VIVVAFIFATSPSPARAGLYSSFESYADLPSQWRGFLLDQRVLRMIGVALPVTPSPPSPLPQGERGADRSQSPIRAAVLERKKRLEGKGEGRSADETADLGAALIRLGEIDRAMDVLRAGLGKHPNHFAIAANLGTAWQLKGDYAAAAQALKQSVRLAPGRHLAAEELHLKLVLGRAKQKEPGNQLDDLFGITFFTPNDDSIADAERKTLTAKQVGLTQQLALWLPNDGPLLWQLAEFANAFGDVRTAASLMEGCVSQFGMTNRDLRRRRLLFKETVEKLPPLTLGEKAGHKEGHLGGLTFRSRKPLISDLLPSTLPAINDTGVNHLPWEVFGSTTFEGKFPPKFSNYLKELDGKTVSLAGFLQPLREDGSAYLFIEFPVGCWYCEMPEMTGIVSLDPPAGGGIEYQRGLQRVVGRLSLNMTDPEEFLFTLRDAKVAPAD
jgi:hypothetical protein